jgi:hypothetical protein
VEKINHDNRNEGEKRQARKERNEIQRRGEIAMLPKKSPGSGKRAKFGSLGRSSSSGVIIILTREVD